MNRGPLVKSFLFGSAVVLGLYIASLYSYPLFHTVVETYIVVIAGSVFVLAWNSRKSLDNNYLLFIGISYLFVGIIELLHMLAYKGIGIFKGFDADLSIQLWIVARYMESLSLLTAPLFLRRKLNQNLTVVIYAVATSFLLGSLFYWKLFPSCFIEGFGLTPFKKISEYVIMLILTVSIVFLLRYRSEFERNVLGMLAVSMFLTILAELSFTFYISLYGLSNQIGHFFTLISFYLIYKAIIVTGLTRPFDLMFRNLSQSEAALKRVNDELEAIVTERTADLIRTNEKLNTELTERKRAEQALSESEERLRLTLAATQIGIFDWDVVHDIWLASPEYYTMLGYAPKDGNGDREEWLARVHPDDQAHVEAKIRKVLASDPAVDPSQSYAYEARLRHADGTYRWVHVKGFGVKLDSEGRMTRMLGIRMDITDRKTAEEALRQLNKELDQRVLYRTAQLEAANRELEGFVYSISHDLRAPLRHIDGFIELLRQKDGTNFDEQSRHYMDTISGAAWKMGRLVDDLLSFSRMGRHAVTPQAVDLVGLVRDILKELEPETAGRRIDWRIGELPVVEGDAAMLRIVLVNLVSNALKFTRPRQQAQIEIGALTDKDSEVVIFVRDNGVGFDMAYADKLFSVFQRLHHADEFEGIGIGLANVHRIIARHGGRTWATGKVDKGATFYFSLPKI